MFDFYGVAFIGVLNSYSVAHANFSSDNIFTKYDGEMVYNFCADFVIPAEDGELAAMITEWNKGIPKKLDLISKIMDRVELLGGANLIWS